MTARVLIVKNIGREGPGILRDVLMDNRVEADVIEIDRGETIPSLQGYRALIVLGGPASANDETPAMQAEIARVREAVDAGLPYLGVCLGHQVLAKAVGATVMSAASKEIGFYQTPGVSYTVALTEAGRNAPLFEGLASEFSTFQLHGETVVPSPDVEVLASSAGGVQAIRVGRNAYGLQCHVELVPEMLAVWCAQDPDLKDFDAGILQKQLAEMSSTYVAIGRRLFENFLRLADIGLSIDLVESDESNAR
jgi:GMP synthase-like glutamine amidotransferase